MNESEILSQLLWLIRQLLLDYVERAEKSAQQSADASPSRSLFDEFQRIVTPLLNQRGLTAAAASNEVLEKALKLVATVVTSTETHVRAGATEYLREAALNPVRAAEAGSLLCDALIALITLADGQLVWLDARFKRSWLDRRLSRPYEHIGPSDLDIRLVELMTALHTTTHDAESALRRLDLMHHPVSDFLLKGRGNEDESATLTTSEPLTPRTIVTMTEASVADMDGLRTTHTGTVKLVKSHATDALNIVQVSRKPGGGVDPRAVRTASVMTVRFCVIALKRAYDEHRMLVELESTVGKKTVDSNLASASSPSTNGSPAASPAKPTPGPAAQSTPGSGSTP